MSVDEPDDALDQTIATYDQVAAAFVERHKREGWWDDPGPNFERYVRYLIPNARILDLGCGPGSETRHFRTRGFRAFGLDRSVGMLAEARRLVGPGFALADMRQLPLMTAGLDGVWMQASLLHLPRKAAPHTLMEVARVLRPDGVLYISVKQGDGELMLSNLAGQPRRFTLYQPDPLAELVTSAGFQIEALWLKETPVVTWISIIALRLPG